MSTNYRPIALSSTLSKVLEQLICVNIPIFSRTIICSLVSNLVVLLPFVLVWLKTLFLDIFTMDLRFLVVSWMPLKLLIQLTILFYSRNCPTEVFLWLLLDFCCLGIVLRSAVFIGVHVVLGLSVFLMVFVKEVFFSLTFRSVFG